MRERSGGRTSQRSRESEQKGHALEDVAALLYSVPGVDVQKRVRLRPPDGKGRPREIDVLITGVVIGYSVRFAVECKNEKNTVEAEKIDAFRGKLEYLGIPVQHGIYISPTGFTKGALEAARATGMRTLVLHGLSKDRLQAELLDAVQSLVFYLAYIKVLEWEVPGIEEGDSSRFQFYDAKSSPAGRPPDFLWKAWQWDESIPLCVGDYEVPIVLPDGCHAIKDDCEYAVASIRGVLGVKAFVVRRTGTATALKLVNSADDSMDRQRVQMVFPGGAGLFDIEGFDSQQDLDAYFEAQGSFHFPIHLRLPRIQHEYCFWPPSARVEEFFKEQQRLFNDGIIDRLGPYTLHEVEGDNLAAVFEPMRIGDELVYPRPHLDTESS